MSSNSKVVNGLPIDYEKYLVAEDRTDERDYIYEDYYSSEEAEGVSKSWDKDIMKIRDQFDQKETYKACSGYGIKGISNGYNVIEYKNLGATFEQEDPKYYWAMFQANRGYLDMGASLQDQMKFAIEIGLIEGYMRIDTMEGTKNALDNGFLIYTGTNKCDWSATSKSGTFVKKLNAGGHCFFIVGYNEDGFIAVNSFGDDWGDDGYFVVPFENYNDMFSKNAIFDQDDTGIIKNLNYENEYKEAIELGITNGTRPDDPVTRKECAVMAYRASKL